MATTGPVVIVDDDIDDQEIITGMLREMGLSNQIIAFSRCPEAYDYLTTTTDSPYFIVCDINMPLMNGVEFKLQIDTNPQLRQKSIPFIFLSTSANQQLVNDVYARLVVQGFFKKSGNLEEIRESLQVILDYWRLSKHPNS
jgi:CheY-like chemotaxis protein